MQMPPLRTREGDGVSDRRFRCKRCKVEYGIDFEVKTRFPTRTCKRCWSRKVSCGLRGIAPPEPEFCGKCGVRPAVVTVGGRRAWCRACRNEYMRLYRRKYRDLSIEEKIKARARSAAKMALRRGQLVRKDCENCGVRNAVMHHDDYAKPLDVRWLCDPCHRAHHARVKHLVPCGTSAL